MREVECAGGLVVNYSNYLSRGSYLLVVTNQIGKHTLPKGTMEPGETPADTARREIREEGGLRDFRVTHYLGLLVREGFTAENSVTPSVIKNIHMFACVTNQLELCPLAPDIEAAYWVHPNELADRLSWPEELAFVEQHRGMLGL